MARGSALPLIDQLFGFHCRVTPVSDTAPFAHMPFSFSRPLDSVTIITHKAMEESRESQPPNTSPVLDVIGECPQLLALDPVRNISGVTLIVSPHLVNEC